MAIFIMCRIANTTWTIVKAFSSRQSTHTCIVYVASDLLTVVNADDAFCDPFPPTKMTPLELQLNLPKLGVCYSVF